jgi:hypothetical protein
MSESNQESSVIVNHSHQFIFVHVPKAAGTSVSELFSKYSAYSDLEVGGTELGEALQHPYKRRFGLTKHSTAAEILPVVGKDTWGRYYSFAFVRDPYARAQSTFHFMKRWHGNKEMKNLDFMDDLSDFRSFVMSDAFKEQKAHRLLWPQVRWLQDEKGTSIVDFVGRMETLDDDIHHVLSHAPGLVKIKAAPEAAPKKNRSASTDAALWDLLSSDAEVERRIYEAYQEDFKAFDYPRFDAKTMPRPDAPAQPVVDPQTREAREARAAGRGRRWRWRWRQARWRQGREQAGQGPGPGHAQAGQGRQGRRHGRRPEPDAGAEGRAPRRESGQGRPRRGLRPGRQPRLPGLAPTGAGPMHRREKGRPVPPLLDSARPAARASAGGAHSSDTSATSSSRLPPFFLPAFFSPLAALAAWFAACLAALAAASGLSAAGAPWPFPFAALAA